MRAARKGGRSVPKVALFLQGVRHYERELLRGISDYANLHGPWQFQRNVSYLADKEVDPVELIERWQPDAKHKTHPRRPRAIYRRRWRRPRRDDIWGQCEF